jgi:Fe-S-cluster containining protein
MSSSTPASPNPWYTAGLRFECTGCGNCCTGQPGYVWVSEQDVRAIAEHLDKPVGEIRLLHTRPVRGKTSLTEYPNGDCTFLDPRTRRCGIYPVRPNQCRTWPFWRQNIDTPDDWQRTAADCPGCGAGPLVTLGQIDGLLAETDL